LGILITIASITTLSRSVVNDKEERKSGGKFKEEALKSILTSVLFNPKNNQGNEWKLVGGAGDEQWVSDWARLPNQ